MAVREIIEAPDPWLRTISDPVQAVDDDLRVLMEDMLETMYVAPGIGLAAVQVGVKKRVIVMDIARQDEDPLPRFFVNPEILWKSDTLAIYSEGCLSLPEHYAEVERPDACHVKYLDYDGKAQIIEAEGLLATCLQHEMDHLEGILFVDHLSALKRNMILRKLTKTHREAETA